MGRFARYRSSRAQLSDIEQQGATTELRRPADTATETTPAGKAHVERNRWTLTVWGLVASATQLGVGMHPVFTRYLQTYAASPMPTFQMMALMEGLALVAVFLCVQLPRMVPNLGWAGLGQTRSGSGKQLEVEAPVQNENTRAGVSQPRAEASGECNSSKAVEEAEGRVGAGTNGSRLEEVALLHGSAREAVKPGTVRHEAEKPSKHWEVLRAALLIAFIATPGETAFLLASRYARAYLLMLVLLFAPMLVAVVSTLLFKQALPSRLVPAILLTTLGAVLAVLGGEAMAVPEVETLLGSRAVATTEAAGTAAVASAGPAGDWKTWVGLGLAAVATFSQAAFQLAVEGTNGVLPEHQVVMAQYCSDAAVACVMSRMFQEPSWERTIAAMETADWGVLLAASLFVYAINNFLIQFTIRRLGAAMSAMFMPLRLCSATAASWLMLGERMKSSVQASGLLLVLTSVTWYLHTQYRAAERQASVPEPELHGSQPARAGTVESAQPPPV